MKVGSFTHLHWVPDSIFSSIMKLLTHEIAPRNYRKTPWDSLRIRSCGCCRRLCRAYWRCPFQSRGSQLLFPYKNYDSKLFRSAYCSGDVEGRFSNGNMGNLTVYKPFDAHLHYLCITVSSCLTPLATARLQCSRSPMTETGTGLRWADSYCVGYLEYVWPGSTISNRIKVNYLFRYMFNTWFIASQGLFGAIFSKLNIQWQRIRKTSWLGKHPVAEVVAITVITVLVSYWNPFAR